MSILTKYTDNLYPFGFHELITKSNISSDDINILFDFDSFLCLATVMLYQLVL